MNTKHLFFLLVFISNFIFGQRISVDSIKLNIQNPESVFYYEKLISKFNIQPLEMSDEEIEYLYYGKSFSNYNSMESNSDYLECVNNFYKGKYKVAKIYCEKYLKKDPTNSEIIWMVKNTYRKDKKSLDYILYDNQEKSLTNCIFKSGDGKTKETPYIVNSVGEEYFIGLLLNEYLSKFSRKSHLQKDSVIDEFTKGNKTYFFKVIYNSNK